MKNSLKEMFLKSSFSVLPGQYVYAKVTTLPAVGDHFMVTRDADEITVVTAEGSTSGLDIVEKNEHPWKLISLNLAVPFTAGTLAAINSACAEAGLNNLVISTYSKDYILVHADKLKEAKSVLGKLGFKEKHS